MHIMLVHFNDNFWFQTARSLASKGVSIDIVTTIFPERYIKDSLFRGSHIFNQNQFQFPELILHLNDNNKESLSEDLINDYIDCENLFLSLSDRFCYFPATVKERKSYYLELLLYWFFILKESKLDLIVFDSTPHMGFDNVIYCIAKYFGIKTSYVQRTLLLDRIILRNDYRLIEKVPTMFLKGNTVRMIKSKIGKLLLNEITEESPWVKRSKIINEKVLGKETSIPKSVIDFIKSNPIKRVINQFSYLSTITNASCYALNSQVRRNLYKYWAMILNALSIDAKRLRKYYEKHTSRINFRKNYIYFPLHYQPERSTMPEGGVFNNQILALDILSKSVPDRWMIYVKEHPRQFQLCEPRKKGARLISDYNKMLSYRNVRLVGVKEDSNKLIKNCVSIATITGSSGWEGMLQGKQSLIFGNPWYSACQSSYYIDSVETCKMALNNMKKKTKKEIELDVLKFICYCKDKFILSSNAHEFADKSGVSYKILVDNLASAIIKEKR